MSAQPRGRSRAAPWRRRPPPGATDAEAWAEGSRSREVRVHAGEVESLTEASGRGVGVRAWIGARTGYAYGTDLSDDGLPHSPRPRSVRPGSPTRTRAPPRPSPRGEAAEIAGLRDPGVASTETAEVIELAKQIERAALDRDERVTGRRGGRLRRRGRRRRHRHLARGLGRVRRIHRLLVPPGDGDAGLARCRPDSASGWRARPARSTPTRSAREAGDERAARCSGRPSPRSRTCPVVLSDRGRRQLRRLHRRRPRARTTSSAGALRSPTGSAIGSPRAALRVADDGIDPGGLASAPFDGEGTPRGRTALIEEGELVAYLHDTYTARRGDASSTGNAARCLVPLTAVGQSLQPDDRAGPALARRAAPAGRRRRLHHRGRRPSFGRQPGHRALLGGRHRQGGSGGELAEPLREFTIAGDLLGTLAAVQAVGSEARWVPFGGSVQQRSDPGRRDGDRRVASRLGRC